MTPFLDPADWSAIKDQGYNLVEILPVYVDDLQALDGLHFLVDNLHYFV